MSLRWSVANWARRLAWELDRPAGKPDEFVEWLMASNAGMQHRGNLACFARAIEELPGPDPVLEIGAHAGLSANILCYLLRRQGRPNRVISVDPWTFRGQRDEAGADAAYLACVGGETSVPRAEYAEFVLDAYLKSTALFSRDNLPYAFRSTSDEFFEALGSRPTLVDLRGRVLATDLRFSLVFIDGNHDHDFAQRDFRNADARLCPGGFVFFDDSADWSTLGCARVAREVEADRRYRLVMKNPNRLFRKVAT